MSPAPNSAAGSCVHVNSFVDALMEAAISYADSHIAHLEAALTDVVNEVLQEK